MNRELLEKRIMDIDKEMTQNKANQEILKGHFGEAHYWLGQLLKAEAEAQAVTPQEQSNPTTEEQQNGEANNEPAEQAA